jgi:nucleotidyltransferase/DNA polymerase involved in DNA repair
LVLRPNKKKSEAAGYPVFDEREYCKIQVPGEKNSLVFQPATDLDRKKYPNAYAAFKNREAKPVTEGMPIEQWPQVTRSMAKSLRELNIHTVEALAAVHDGNIGKLGHDGRQLRAKAQAFLETAKAGAQDAKLAAENEKLKTMLEDQQAQINQLAKALEKKGKKEAA